MKIKLLLLSIFLSACGGSLTDEQRKKAKESIALNQIKKITDSEITAAAFTYGRTIANQVAAKNPRPGFIDSLAASYHVKILLLKPGDTYLSDKEKLIMEAYASVTNKSDFSDNIQKISADSILYTQPILKENPDGSFFFDHALGIRMPKKEIVLSIKN